MSDSSHPVGGEGVGSSAPMSAGCGRAMKPGGRIPRGSLRRSMDGLRLLAAGQWSGPLAAPCPSRVAGSNVRGGDPVRPEARAASRRARGKRLRGAVPSLPDRDFTGGSEGRPRSGFVETVTLQQHRARPGRPAPSPTRRESRRRRVMRRRFSLPRSGEGCRRAAPTGWGIAKPGAAGAGLAFPTRASLRFAVPPHEGEGEPHRHP